MADYNGDNYKAQWVDKPSSKFPKGENAGRKRLLLEHYTTVGAVLVGEKIFGPKIPASSIVTDAKVKITSSLGATGIFDLGHLASASEAADSDAFVSAADGGGQAALKRSSGLSVGVFKRFADEIQLVLTCTEITVNAGVKIEFEVEYVND